MYADIVATAALVTSLVAGLYTWRTQRKWDRPVVQVRGQQWVTGTSEAADSRASELTVEVENRGNQATEIYSVAWELDKGEAAVISVGTKVDESGSVFPIGLGRNQMRRFEIKSPHKTVLVAVRMRPVAEIMTREGRAYVYGDWQEPMARRHFDQLFP